VFSIGLQVRCRSRSTVRTVSGLALCLAFLRIPRNQTAVSRGERDKLSEFLRGRPGLMSVWVRGQGDNYFNVSPPIRYRHHFVVRATRPK
jgi:hypothetical protein